METTPTNQSEETSPLAEEAVQGWAQVQLSAYRCVITAGRADRDALVRLLQLPATGNRDISPTTVLHMSLTAARVVCALPSLDDEVLEALLLLLQHLCRQWHANDIATITIIGILQDVCHHLHRCSDDDNRSNYIVLVTGILKFIRKKKYGAHVCDRFVRLLGHIAQVDECGRWTSRMTDDGTMRPFAHELLSFLTSPFHQVRMTACQQLWALFLTSSVQHQQSVLDDLLVAVNDVFIIQGDLAAEEQLEEGVSRTASALHTLAAALAVKSRWRSRVLLHTCILTVDKTLNTDLVKKMLTVVATHMGMTTLDELVQPMLPSVLWAWHERFNSLDRFPWPVLGYTSENHFYQANLAAVVPVLVHRRDNNTLNHIAPVVGQHVKQLVQVCYPVLLGSILPRFADENQQQTATIIIGIVEKYLGDEKVNTMLISKMGDVMSNMLATLYDPDSLRVLCDGQLATLPEPTKLMFATDLVLGGVHYIQENSPKSDMPLLVYLSQEKPRLIQKTLLKLYSKVHQTKIPEYRLLHLHQFVALCDLVVAVIDRPQFKLAHFSISWPVRVLLHLTQGDTGLLAVSYLCKFLTAVLPTHADTVDSLLPAITAKLIPLASEDTAIGRKALSALQLLLVTNASSLPSVTTLDPLPDQPMFAAMSQQYLTLRYSASLSKSLQAEIEHVLSAGACDSVCRPEGLRHLRKQLSEKKPELKQLFSELRATRGFSEDCERSILHRLICLLIRITAGPDPEARYEAACCLGELGPADLTTLGLRPDSAPAAVQPLDCFLRTVLSHLTKHLVDPKVEVVQATSDALYALFGNFNQQLNGLLTGAQTELLFPFVSTARGQRRPAQSSVSVDEDALTSVVPLFCPEHVCSHRLWVSQLVNTILNAAQFGFLVPVVDHKEEFANDLFPVLVEFVLDISSRTATTQLFVEQINEFFARHANNTSTDEVYSNRNSVFAMLKLVDSVRKHVHEERRINYLHVSRAALFCSAYFTSVMYAELWASEVNSNREDLDVEGISQLEFIEEKDAESGQLLQNLLREAYMKIGEPDAVYGCGNTHLLDPRNQVQHYQYERRWLRVVETCDLQLSLQPSGSMERGGKELETALHLSGLHHLAASVSGAAPGQGYEAAWRLGRWELAPASAGDTRHEVGIYTALRAARDGDTARVLSVVRQARSNVMESLAHTSLEAAINVYTPLAKLRALQEIEDFTTLDFAQVTVKWKNQDKIGWNNFTNIEPILAQRMALMKISKDLDQERMVQVVTELCEAVRREGFHTVAYTWLMSLPGLHQLPTRLLRNTQLLQAQIYWDKQEMDTARHLLRRLLGQLKDSDDGALYAKTLHTYGSLVAHTRTEQAPQIMEKYLIPAVDNADEEFKLLAALSLAQYADSEYQTLLNYIKSSAYTSKMNSITESLTSAQKLTKAAVASSKVEVDRQTKIDLHKTINMHDKQSKIDQMEVENAQRELDNFLLLAIRHYLLSLELGDRQELCVFRVVSLWLNNYQHAELGAEMSKRAARVPSHKLLPVLPQLAARISDSGDEGEETLHTLIERCARDHPHHVVPLIMALANTYKDADYSQSTINTGAKPEGRVVGAQKMLDRLKQQEPLKTLVRDMQKVAEAYISLAYLPHGGGNSKVTKIPKSEPLMKLKNVSHVLCPTVTLPISRSANYTDIVGIQGFGETYYSVGGINVPKKITCICTDGMKRPQLVKGNDDLRQDAVMQQVFNIMNSLLSENKETRQRRLLIRTYKVVPLSQRSGVIEWCVNTTPLSIYLVGGGGVVGAHPKYRKNDWLPSECRQKVCDAAKTSVANKLRVFKEICAHFKPVFRHFFFEKFSNPGIWFERKLAYIHSVATSSMVGYILGLGDRHILNILIDERTAELIHIDFGIAFEQGRTLMTPETIPFRLTRDIIDGMGVAGIEGVFRRSCEKTMEVMRECESTIVTILEVLLYDPLYMWTITPAMAVAKQQGGRRPQPSTPSQGTQEQGQVNKLAERALLRLKQKLQGIEEGSTTSVEGQVSKLIQEATNPANLCRLFHGWQAHV